MRWRVSLCVSLLLGSSANAVAADKLQFGPAGSWVVPLPVPDTAPGQQSAPVSIVLMDSQVRLEPGRITEFSDRAIRFHQPAGLQAGTLAIHWSPELDEVTVHKVVIERAGEEIDVLARGQTFQILRREQNLDQAVLDGTLTAVLQPEGLQVGDTLRISSTTVRRDPVLRTHSGVVSGLLPGILPQHSRLLVQWPDTVEMRFQAHNMAAPKIVDQDGWKAVEWRLDNPAPLVLPDDAPGRFQWGRQVEFTDLRSWGDIGTLLGPLYERASEIPIAGPLRAELERIRAASSDAKTRAQAALRLVQDQVRYVALQMGAGGLTPATAEETWSRRFGDCKAKTALLLGLLRELGIQAAPVAVNAQNGDGLDKRLPLIALLNHVLVRATIDGRDYWLDGTRNNDPSLELIGPPAFHWGVPLVRDASLVRIMPPPARRPTEETTIYIDARKGGSAPAPTNAEVVFRGDDAIVTNLVLTTIPQETRNEALKAFWKDRLSHVEAKSMSFVFNRDHGELRMTMEGDAKLKLRRGAYWVDVPTPGYKPDFDRPAGPYQQAPFALNYPRYTKHKQTIIVPDEMIGALHGAEPIDVTVAGVRYRRTTVKTGTTFVIEASSQVLQPELEYAVARASEEDLRELDKKDYYVVVDKPSSDEIDQLLKAKAEDVDELISRAATLAWAGRHKEAIAEYDKVLAKEPNNSSALEGRGFSRAQIGELKLARADYEAAVKLGSKVPFLHFLAANEAMERKDWTAAILEINKALALAPDNAEVLMARAEIQKQAGHRDAALADAAAVLRINPNFAPAYLLRVNLYRQQNQSELALAEADALMKRPLSDPYGYVAAAKTYAAYDRMEEAMRAFDKAIAIKPEAYIYLNRADTRPSSDLAARKADVMAGLEFEPDHPDLLVALARIDTDLGLREEAAAALQKLKLEDTNDVHLRIRRGVTYAKLGQAARAEADFAYVRAEAENDAAVLNFMCSEKVNANVVVESALVDCDNAILLNPEADSYHATRGMALLRLGRFDDAVAAFTRAMATNPAAKPLFGRAVAWSRKGDKDKAAEDAAAAKKLNSGIRKQFADLGLTL